MTSPVIRVLKTQIEATVHIATQTAYAECLLGNPYLDRAFEFNKSFSEIHNDLRREQYDLVIDLQNDFQSKVMRWRLRKKALVINKMTLKEWLLSKFKINLLPNTHVVERFIDLLSDLGIKMDNLGLDYFIPDKDIIEKAWLPETHQNGYVVVALSTAHKTRQLPTPRLIELCDRINKPIILLGEKGDKNIADEIEAFFKPVSPLQEKELEELNKRAIIFNGCDKFNLNQSASIIEQASWVFTHQNAIMQIAAAFKKQLFTIWGNTIPEFGKYPYRTQFTLFENKKLSCRPCTASGYDRCPKGHFKCMNEVTFDFYLPD